MTNNQLASRYRRDGSEDYYDQLAPRPPTDPELAAAYMAGWNQEKEHEIDRVLAFRDSMDRIADRAR